MKEPITKFTLEMAFKDLDKLDVPAASKEPSERLNETLTRVDKTDKLLEDYYDLADRQALQTASDERAAEVAKAKLARIEKIVDIDAKTEEDILPTYVGRTIIQCPQCMTLFYKKPEDIVKDENKDTFVNVGEQCPNCNNSSGFTIIGKVAPEVLPEATKEEEKPEDTTMLNLDTEQPEETVEQSEETLEQPEETVEQSEEILEQPEETSAPDLGTEESEYQPKEQALDKLDTEEEKPEEDNTDEEKSEEETTEKESEKDEKKKEEKPAEEKKKNESLVESSISLTEDEYSVSESELKDLFNSPEFKKPISDSEVKGYLRDLKDKDFASTEPYMEDISHMTNFLEKSFNESISNCLRTKYTNVDSFTTTGCKMSTKALKVNGTLQFKSGKSKQAMFKFFKKPGNILEGYCTALPQTKVLSLRFSAEDNGESLLTESIEIKRIK